MATILDIAEKAGVSHSAVAAVLRGQGEKRRIAPATCERILKIAEELNYLPNSLARSLRTGSTAKVGIISHSQPRINLQRARAASGVFIDAGYRILWQDLAWRPESEATLIREAISEQVQGLFLESGTARTAADESMQVLAELARRKFPLVRIDAEKGLPIDVVLVNREIGAFKAVSHLFEVGHRRIGLMVRKDDASLPMRERVRGFTNAHREWGIPLSDRQFIDTGLPPMASTQVEYDFGYQSLSLVMQSTPRVSAVIAANDYMAMGLINAARDHGVRMPDDLAVMGFGSYELATFSPIPLTTVAYPFEAVARRGAEMLIERMNGLKAKPRKVRIESELIVRTSCGAGKNSVSQQYVETANCLSSASNEGEPIAAVL